MPGFSEILGQYNAVDLLKTSLETGRVAHAYLFAGPSGVGKKLTAAIFARALNCKGDTRPCDSCVSCQKALHLNHPDIVYFKPEGLSFKIEQARDLQKLVHSRVYEGKYKVFIIEDMHRATIQASNSLLKTLEEPPGNSVFVLLSESPNSLPQTIISRCQRVNFAPLGKEVIEKVLVERGYDNSRAGMAAELSFGSIGKALEIVENENFLSNKQKAIEFIQVALSQNYFNLYKLIEAIDKEKIDHKVLIEQMSITLRDVYLETLYNNNPHIPNPELKPKFVLTNKAVEQAMDLLAWAGDLANKQTNSKLLLDVLGIKLGRLA